MRKSVTYEGYLTVSCPAARKNPQHPGLWKTTASLKKNKPSVGADEVAVKVRVELPAVLFQTPQLEAKITVPDDSVTPPVLDLEVRDNIEQMLIEQTGFDIRLVQIGEGGDS